jgi:hypothetical protein
MTTKKMLLGMLALAVLSAIPASASAQSSTRPASDGRWTPYLGCWRLLAENVRNQNYADWIRSAAGAATPVMTVCVQPSSASAGSVTMTTFADGKKVLEQIIVADGAAHPVPDSGCAGTETSDWSHDGSRLFTRVEMTCNNRPKQTVSGLTLFAKGPTWVDIQAMESDGDQQVRIRRYTRSFDQPEGMASLPPAVSAQAIIDAQNASVRMRLSKEDVMEAVSKVASQAVEAAIVETDSRFNLNSRTLVELADAGVSPNVIDLMVAQSFPSHFKVERQPDTSLPPITASMPPPIVGGIGGIGAQYPYPIYPYDPYSYYSYYYSPFAYPYYWGGYNRGSTYYISNGTVITGGSAAPSTSVSGGGTVVNGRGYTRVHTESEAAAAAAAAADPNQHTTTSTPRTVRTTTPAGADSSSSSSSPSSSSGSSSSGGVSSSGYSSGGGGGDSGRTAQPK